jgi:hypothetical protein
MLLFAINKTIYDKRRIANPFPLLFIYNSATRFHLYVAKLFPLLAQAFSLCLKRLYFLATFQQQNTKKARILKSVPVEMLFLIY